MMTATTVLNTTATVPCGHNYSSACGPWGCLWRLECPVCFLQVAEHDYLGCLERLRKTS